MLARQVAEEALAREAPELGRRALQLLRRLEPRQLLVALVDLLDVERVLQPGEVEVVLLVEVGDEAVGAGRGTRRARGWSGGSADTAP